MFKNYSQVYAKLGDFDLPMASDWYPKVNFALWRMI